MSDNETPTIEPIEEELVLTIDPPYIGSPYSPQVSIDETASDVTVTITDALGEHSYTIVKPAFDETTVEYDLGTGTPSVEVTASGSVGERDLHFDFKNMGGFTAQAISDAQAATASANNAATAANNAASAANAKAELADTAANNATNKASAANSAANAASAAASNADEKAGFADAAATLANSKAEAANDAAELANTKARLADAAAAAASSAATAATDAAVFFTSLLTVENGRICVKKFVGDSGDLTPVTA